MTLVIPAKAGIQSEIKLRIDEPRHNAKEKRLSISALFIPGARKK